LLSQDKLYFKCKGDRYEPRSASQVESLRHQQQLEQEKAQQQRLFWQKLRERLQGQEITWNDSDQQRLQPLINYALHGEASPHKSLAQELLAQLHRPKHEQAALELLVDLGIWSIHENLALLRNNVPCAFSEQLLTYATNLVHSGIADGVERRDLTHLQVYTIDDATTREIDDGLSWDGRKVWIHIADPTRWITPNDPLDREARQRGTSIYLPTGTICMFPPLLAEGLMSLVQGQKCHALSFGVELDNSGVIANYEICPSYIVPTYRLTYEDVNQLLELGVEQDLTAIAELARRRSQWRSAQGAININLPETQIKVIDQGSEIALEMQQNTFARQLVAEMMILAGEVAATYAHAQQIPIPYRTQSAPDLPSPEKLAQLPPGVVRDFAICRCMTKGEMSIYPAPHAGLGLSLYTQATSPIRRYTDLLVHWQIKAHLSQQTLPFSAEQVDMLLKGLEPAIATATQLERQTQRYWTLEYLRRQQGQVWQVVLLDWLREQDKLGLIFFQDLGLKLPMRFNRSVAIGEVLRVQVSEVNPRQDIIAFAEVSSE
jgi:exoribonuclease-2